MDILDTAQDILAMSVRACVGHELHEEAQVIRSSWNRFQAKEDDKIKPLPDM